MQFFSDCKTQCEAKDLFRKLSKHFHPDVGGDADLMRELIDQYDKYEYTPPVEMPTNYRVNDGIRFDHPIYAEIAKERLAAATYKHLWEHLNVTMERQHTHYTNIVMKLQEQLRDKEKRLEDIKENYKNYKLNNETKLTLFERGYLWITSLF